MTVLTTLMRLRLRYLWLVMVSVVVVLGFTQSSVSAHNSLVESNPKDGAMLAAMPLEWTLTFKSDVPLNSATGEVIDSSGVRIALPSPRHGIDAKQIVFSLPQNLVGAVTARWKLVNTDGHVVSERVSFTIGSGLIGVPGVGSTSTTTVPSSVMTAEGFDESSTPEAFRFGLRLFGYIAILVYGGLILNAMLIGPSMWSLPKVVTAALASSAALAIAPLGQLLVYLDDIKGSGIPGSFPRMINAFDTTAGSMLLVRTLVGAIVFVLVARRASLTSLPVYVLSCLYLFSLAYVGHSRSSTWPLLGVPVDVVHTASVAVWLGGLTVFALVVTPQLTPHESIDGFRRFGRVAQWAVTLIVVTGIIQTLRLHTTVVTLMTESHGRWLVLKLIVVAMMLKVGDINRRRIAGRLPEGDVALLRHNALVRRASLTEIATGGLVTVVTSVLVASSVS